MCIYVYECANLHGFNRNDRRRRMYEVVLLRIFASYKTVCNADTLLLLYSYASVDSVPSRPVPFLSFFLYFSFPFARHKPTLSGLKHRLCVGIRFTNDGDVARIQLFIKSDN